MATNLLIKQSIQRKKEVQWPKKKEKKPLLNRVAKCTLKIIIEELKNKVFFSSNDSQSNEVVTPYHLKWFHDSWYAFMSKT